MLAPEPLSLTEDSRKQLRKLGWELVRRSLLSVAAAVGTKVGEALVDAVLGRDEEEDEDDGDGPK